MDTTVSTLSYYGCNYVTATIGSESLREDVSKKAAAGLSLFLCIYLHTPGDTIEIANGSS